MTKKNEMSSKKKKFVTLPLSRPATPNDIVDRARQYGPACIDVLAEVAARGTGACRVSAANALLDRGFGKVGQGIEITGKGGGCVDINVGVSPIVSEFLKSLSVTE